MVNKIFKHKAQNTAEYAILIGLVVAAAIAMQTYVKRGLQGRVREVVDHVSTEGEIGGLNFDFSGEQYEPYYRYSDFSATSGSTATSTTTTGGGTRKDVSREEVSRTGEEVHELGRASNE